MKKFIVDLERSKNKLEEYEKNKDYETFELNDSNLAIVKIQLPNGKVVNNQGYRVYLNLSKDAMIGLGVSLIRAAHRPKSEYGFWHLHPSDEHLASQEM